MKLMKENEDLRVEIIKIKSEEFQKYETLKKNNEEFVPFHPGNDYLREP